VFDFGSGIIIVEIASQVIDRDLREAN